MAELTTSKEEFMNDRTAFELAMRRVQNQAHREGKKPTFGELLTMAKHEQEQEYERCRALAANLPED